MKKCKFMVSCRFVCSSVDILDFLPLWRIDTGARRYNRSGFPYKIWKNRTGVLSRISEVSNKFIYYCPSYMGWGTVHMWAPLPTFRKYCLHLKGEVSILLIQVCLLFRNQKQWNGGLLDTDAVWFRSSKTLVATFKTASQLVRPPTASSPSRESRISKAMKHIK
jgi:hypothetical protein